MRKVKTLIDRGCQSPTAPALRRDVLPDDALHALLILHTVPPEQVIGIGLRRRVWIRVVQQVLDPQQDLPDRDRRLPALVLVENRETDGA